MSEFPQPINQPSPNVNEKQPIISWHNILSKKILIGVSLFIVSLIIGFAISTFLIPKDGKIAEIKPQREINQPQRKVSPTDTLSTDGFVKLTLPQREPPFFTLTARTVSRFGILPQETFILSAKDPIETDFIKKHLKTSIPVALASDSQRKFRLTPTELLGKNEIFQAKLLVKDREIGGHTFDRNYSWAFQTQGKFRVTSYLPGDKKTGVPVNTGIEITFSQDDYKDPKRYIRIDPSIDFRIERHDETVAIVPLKPLLPKTIYKVTLRKGLNLTSRNDPIEEDFTFSFQTAEEQKRKKQVSPQLSLAKTFVQVSTKEPPMIKVFTSDWDNTSVKTKVYQFPNSQQFLKSREKIDQARRNWFNYFPEKDVVETANLSLVTQADLKVETKDRLQYLKLPDSLPSGFYLLQFWYGQDEQLNQLWLQVTNIAGYVAVGRKQTTVWVNKLDDGQPAAGATVKIVGMALQFTTNDQGVALFETPTTLFEDSNQYLSITSQDQKTVILPVLLARNYTSVSKEDYWVYLYHERKLYKPNDTVYFWGVARHRDTNQPPETLSVLLSKSRQYGDKSPPPLVSKSLTPQADGTFFGSISFSELPPEWYYLSLRTGDLELTSAGFRVFDYVKPEMTIEVTTDRKAVFSDNQVEFTIQANFYDETPVSYIPVKIFEESTGKSTELTTDGQGQISYQYTPRYSSSSTRSYHCITASPATAQQSQIEGNGCVLVFNNKLTISSKSSQENNQAYLTATVHRVDLIKYNQDPSADFKGNPATGQKLTLTLTKKWWEKVEKGTYYDFIEKITRPQYEYIRHQEKIDTKELVTNAQGEISYQFTLEKDKSYQVSLVTYDDDQHPISQETYFYYRKSTSVTESQPPSVPQLTLLKKENTFSLGEEVNLTVNYGDKEYPDSDKNRFLFIMAQRGNQQVFVEEEPQFNFSFQEKHIPNTSVSAIIFTGKSYQITHAPCLWQWSCSYYYYYDSYSLPGLMVVYQQEDAKLDLSLSYDKKSYKPGDQAKVTVTVKNQQDQPVTDAHLNLVLVDHALDAIGGVVKPSVLTSLYQSVESGIYFSYHSHQPVIPDEPEAEMGGGGGVREIFKDTAFFGEAITNQQGQAEFNFSLPDNITSWRVYAQAVSPNLMAGQQKGNVIVSQDFFVVPGFTRQFLTKDKPLLVGSAFGKGAKLGGKVNYQAAFYQEGQEISKTEKQQGVFKPVAFDFPKLGIGSYKLSLEGLMGNFKDKIVLPFQVIESRFAIKQQLAKTLTAGERLTLPGVSGILTDKPFTLVVSDQGKGKYYWQLVDFCYQKSNRLEKNLAREVANRILKEGFKNTNCSPEEQDLTKFQSSDGGLSQVWWGASHLEKTVWAVYVNPQPFDQEKLIAYLKKQLNQAKAGTIQQIQAAWGLASLDKPMVSLLRYYADQAVTYKEKVLVALSLATAGETEKARELYYDILADYAYENRPYVRIQSQPFDKLSTDQIVKDSSMALLLGVLVEPEYNDGLYAYLRDFQAETSDIVLDLGQMAFIQDQLNEAPQQFTKIRYTSASRAEAEEMTTGGSWSLQIEPAERDNFVLEVVAGKAEVTTGFFVGPEGLSETEPDKRLTLVRSFKKVKGEGADWLPGDIIRVTLDFDFDQNNSPRGRYIVTDLLPSGLAYLKNPENYGLSSEDWVAKHENNIVQFRVYNLPWWLKYNNKQLIYYARVAASGAYQAEPALFQSELDPSVFTYTPAEEVVIGNR